MALPHPKSRKDNYREGHKPDDRGVVRKFLKRTVNITGDRDGKDNVNPAKNRTLGGFLHLIHFLRESTLKPVVLPEVLPGQSWESSY